MDRVVGRDLLKNQVFGGLVVWGQLRVDPKAGVADGKVGVRRKADEGDLIAVERPDLRIVDAALFERVQRKLQARRGDKAGPRVDKGHVEAKYFLTGFVKCAVCGGPFQADAKINGSGQRVLYYKCETTKKAGASACSNRKAVPGDWLEELAAQALTATVQPGYVLQVVREELVKAQAQRVGTPRRRSPPSKPSSRRSGGASRA